MAAAAAVVMALAGCGASGGSSSSGSAKTTTTIDPGVKAIKDGNVALCNDGGYSDNDDFSATCSGGDGIDKWLAPFGQCEDGTVIKMSPEATCQDNGGFKKLLPANYKPKAAKGDVAQCKDRTFSDNTGFSATCSSRGGVSTWLAPYGQCKDGTVIKMSNTASCVDHDGFKGLLPADYTPPTPTTTTSAPKETTTSAPAYAYAGPKYEVVTVDKGAGMGVIDQYWVYTDKLDYSTDAYKDQIRLLISDVARSAGTNKVIVQVVTDKEIAAAEANSTTEDFVAEYGNDYFLNTIPEKEKTGWVASYTGGIDYDAGTLSDSNTAFGIDWFGYSENPTSERWKP